jgi:hypothetical protein
MSRHLPMSQVRFLSYRASASGAGLGGALAL